MKKLIWAVIIILALWGIWAIAKHKAPTPATPTPDTVQTATTLPAIGTLATANTIVVDTPKANAVITSPVKVSGRARGNWFFEASAPVIVLDTNGKILGNGTIKATGDWMTTDFVPFTGSITFLTSSTTPVGGAVVFMNDNPSGQASTSSFFAVPTYFGTSTSTKAF